MTAVANNATVTDMTTSTTAPALGDTVTTTAPQSGRFTRWTVAAMATHLRLGPMARLERPGQRTWVTLDTLEVVR